MADGVRPLLDNGVYLAFSSGEAMTMIERVAKAIAKVNNMDDTKDNQPLTNMRLQTYREVARAAIAAMREPTKKMWLQGDDAVNWHDDIAKSMGVWRAMIDAALEEK